MDRGKIKAAQQLWASNEKIIFSMARHHLNAGDLIAARVWMKREKIEKIASSKLLRLVFIDNHKFEFHDTYSFDKLEIGVETRRGDEYLCCPLPLKLEVDIHGPQIDINLAVPRDNLKDFKRLRKAWVSAGMRCFKPKKQQILWPNHSLGTFEIDKHTSAKSLTKTFTEMLQRITIDVLEPLVLSMQKLEKKSKVK